MSTRTLDSKDFAIGILSTTAVILLVGLVVLHTRPAPALADGMVAEVGDYVITVGGVSVADEEYVYVLDSPMERVIAYRFDPGRSEIQIVQGIDMAELRKGGTPQARPGVRGRGRP